MIVYSFVFFLLAFVAIGAASVAKSKGTNEDYLLAGHSVKPWLVALSAVATNNSGYMFVGQIGYTYEVGLSSIWLMIGWVLGDLVASLVIYRRLRIVTEKRNVLSFGGLLSRWHEGTSYTRLRLLVGIVTVVFLGTYAAAQLKAGSKALHVLFGWDYSTGAVIGFAIVAIYCLAGGIRASIWTDAAQSIVMIFAMAMLLWVTVGVAGGPSALVTRLESVSDTYWSLIPPDLALGDGVGFPLFVMGWMFAGFAVAGQPHIVIRYMTLDEPKHLTRVRIYYYAWYVAFYLCAIGVGMAARLLLPDVDSFDPELALPMLAADHLPDILVGVVLAGLFAATMSTADSQILSCSAALTRDILPKRYDTSLVTKGGTLLVASGALVFALFGGSNVFSLVLIAWSVLGAAFAPMLFLYAFGRHIGEAVAVLMVVVGVGVTILFRELALSIYVYEVLPGMLAGFSVWAVGERLGMNVEPAPTVG